MHDWLRCRRLLPAWPGGEWGVASSSHKMGGEVPDRGDAELGWEDLSDAYAETLDIVSTDDSDPSQP